ncbi:MAG: tRNA threonylcarbamoyladenosine dehydratase, partial [Actinomycetota bacterium]|nr:tRNA threonylcarbamoyladenosine dehydratase [Actinomycetota bacterium]
MTRRPATARFPQARPPRPWSPPVAFELGKPEDEDRLASALEDGEIRTVIDPIEHVANGLFELRHTERRDDARLRADFVRNIVDQGPAFGRWWLFEWSGQLVRFPERDDLRALRTFRNRDLITPTEQAILYSATIAVFGLSVGSNVVERLVGSGIGGTFILADMDIIEPSNLNRINGVFSDVGEHKVDFVA